MLPIEAQAKLLKAYLYHTNDDGDSMFAEPIDWYGMTELVSITLEEFGITNDPHTVDEIVSEWRKEVGQLPHLGRYLGHSNFTQCGWFHPDDAEDSYILDGKRVFVFRSATGHAFQFVHQGGDIYSFNNYQVFSTDGGTLD